MSEIIPFDAGKLSVSIPTEELSKYESLSSLMTGQKEGFEEMQRDWRPAILKIVQPVTTDSAKGTAQNGDLFHTGGLVKRPLRAVLVYAWTSRVRFVQGDDKFPSCSSENVDLAGRGPQDKSLSIYGDSCAKCPFGDQPFSTGKQTNCNNVLNTIIIPANLENIFHIQFSKSSYTVGRQFTNLAMATPQAWSRFYDINTEAKKREKKQGLYFVPTVTPVADTEVPDHLKAFASYVRARIHEMRQTRKTMVVERRNAVASRASLDTIDVPPIDSDQPNFSDKI